VRGGRKGGRCPSAGASGLAIRTHSVYTDVMDDAFEWDEAKRLANIAERGVDFAIAALIFSGPVVEAEDARGDHGERRFRAVGRVGDECYVVAYTWRDRARRIITAWKVGEDGRRRYQALLAGRA